MNFIQISISNHSVLLNDRWSLTSAILASAVMFWLFPDELAGLKYDDAYITFRYANNLIDGVGLVFNEAERVSAASSLSYVLILAALKLVLPFDLVTLATVVGVLGAIILLWSLGSLTAELKLSSFASTVIILGIATSPVYLYWASSGMETPLFVAAVVVAVRLWISNAPTLLVAVSFAFLILTRLEGIIVPFCLLAGSVGIGRRISSREIILFGSAVSSFVTWVIGHRIYYGDWLPNSVHNRGQIIGYDGSNFERLSLWTDRIGVAPEFMAVASFVLAVAIWIGVFVNKSTIRLFDDTNITSKQSQFLLFTCLFALTGFGISLVGPKADLHRYILQYVPFVLIFVGLSSNVLGPNLSQIGIAPANLILGGRIGTIVIFVAIFIHYVGVVEPITNHWHEHAKKRELVSEWARSHIPVDTRILSSDVGMVGYKLIDREVVDAIGLTSGLWRTSDLQQEHENLKADTPSGMWVVDTKWPSGEIQAVAMLNSPEKFLVHWPSEGTEIRSGPLKVAEIMYETTPTKSGHSFVVGVISK